MGIFQDSGHPLTCTWGSLSGDQVCDDDQLEYNFFFNISMISNDAVVIFHSVGHLVTYTWRFAPRNEVSGDDD